MPSDKTISGCILAIQAVGFRPPAEAADVASVWRKVFAGVTDRELDEAVTLWLATDTRGFWPTPGAIRDLVPARPESPKLLGDDRGMRWEASADPLTLTCGGVDMLTPHLPWAVEDVRKVIKDQVKLGHIERDEGRRLWRQLGPVEVSDAA